jgi:hypothetical protein
MGEHIVRAEYFSINGIGHGVVTYQYIWTCSSKCRGCPSGIVTVIPSPGIGGQVELGL